VVATVLGGLWARHRFLRFVGVANFFGSIDRYWRDQYISVKI